MDPIIGEFTITSGSDPAIFHTTFARSVNLDEGYELALKSIYHGPVKNLVYNKFKLFSHDKSMELELTPRYYRAPSEILLDIHQAIVNSDTAVPLLIEKDGQLKMSMTENWIEVNEGMFLNQNFNYVLYEPESQLVKRKKKQKAPETFEIIGERISRLKQIMLGKSLRKGVRESVDYLEKRFLRVEERVTTLRNLGEYKKSDETRNAFLEINNNIVLLVNDFEKVFDSVSEGDQDGFKFNVLSISDKFVKIEMMIDALEKSIIGDNQAVKSIQGQIVFLQQAFDKTNYYLDEVTPKPRTYSIDKSQMVARQSHLLKVTEISVSMKPVEKTILAFLYASPVENSLINNKESRMLTPIPVTSKKGYNYVEFAQPLYRKISVRHFMDISFEILDKNGKKVEFNLYGDDLDQENREYPTILNLHIRRAI